MSAAFQEFLDIDGLSRYDELIKEQIPSPDEKTIILNEDGNLEIKKKPTVQNEILIL